MSKRIIGLVGETGSGKDTFCRIAEKLSPSVLSVRFSEVLSKTLGLFFDEIKKEDQQWLASSLRDRFGEDILMQAISKKIKETEADIIIVNGMRVKEEFDFIKKEGGTTVYLTLDPKKRWERIKGRGEKKDDDVSYEKFLEIDRGRTEVQIKEIGKIADIVIKNDKDLNYLEEEVKKIIEKL
jgi:dephospho-CoA kinase